MQVQNALALRPAQMAIRRVKTPQVDMSPTPNRSRASQEDRPRELQGQPLPETLCFSGQRMEEMPQTRVVDGEIQLELFEKEVYVSSYLGGAFSMAYSNVSGSPLAGVDLGDLDLSHVTFDGNDLSGTDFSGTDLSFATGLETTSDRNR